MNKNILLRIILDLLITFCISRGWWYFALPLGFVGAWSFPYFFELIIAGIAYDSLFRMVPGMGWGSDMGTIVSVISMLIISGVKRFVR